ncbi:uncharacterized protein IWZ02DRAFT_73644 [Phyllosticta citriasiana]|uniref:Secreted protein n=1 Tax=Phyllosticta citriasiana TaxID=595635 RepID=A0ABR1KVQ7_9PEZI
MGQLLRKTFFAVGCTAMSHADIASARSLMQGRRVTPGTDPTTINLQPWHHLPTHQQGRKPRGHQNMFNLQLCCDISIVAAAAAVCRHRATPLLDQAISQTRPLTPKNPQPPLATPSFLRT